MNSQLQVKITLKETIGLLKSGHQPSEHMHDWGSGSLGQIVMYYLEHAEQMQNLLLETSMQLDRVQELNMNNYSHDDVDDLNHSVILIDRSLRKGMTKLGLNECTLPTQTN